MRHPLLLATCVLLTAAIAGVTVFNFSLAVPFIETVQGDTEGTLSRETPLGFLAPLFEGLDAAGRIRLIALLLLAGALTNGLLVYAYSRTAQFLGILIDRDLRRDLFAAAMSADLSYLQRQKTTNLFTLIHTFPGSATKILAEYMKALQNVATFAALTITLLLISWQLTLVAGVIGLTVNLIVIRLSSVIARFAYRIRETRLELHRHTMESLHAVKLIRLFGRHAENQQEFETRVQEHRRNQFRKGSLDALVQPLQSVLSAGFMAAVLIAATFVLAAATEAWVPMLVLFIVVSTRFQSQSGKYAKRRTTIAGELPELEAVMDFLDDTTRTTLIDGTIPHTALRQGIHLEKVQFRYENDAPLVLHGIDLTIPRGQMVAIVGRSGAGKSTLVDLLTRLHDPTSGRITIDGTDLRALHIDTWRRRVAVVSQTPFLFNATIRDNIRYGRPTATDPEVEEAARVADAHDFISAFPHGYDTPIGDRGARLSGGQAQRLAIARAVLADPEVLILDEATSALDARTERAVQVALDRLRSNRTVIAIAHRLATIRRADRIVVLEDGRITESGTHDELIAHNGDYALYVRLQDLATNDGGRRPMRPLPRPRVVPAP